MEPKLAHQRLTAMGIRRVATVLLAAAVATTLLAVPAGASCVMPEGSLKQRLHKAKIVFVGTVANVQANGRLAHVAVDSVWAGEVANAVRVRGGTLATNTASSVDRDFKTGRRYLFVPYRGNGEIFHDSSCSDTQAWQPQFARLRPADAREVNNVPDQARSEAPVDEVVSSANATRLVVWIAGGLLLALLALGGVMFLRRRTPAST